MEKVIRPPAISEKELKKEAEGKRKERKQPKFILLSGHDGTLLAFFSALRCEISQCPDYAARVEFELVDTQPDLGPVFYDDDFPVGRFFLNVSYNDIPLRIPGCALDRPDGAECEFTEFREITHRLTIEDLEDTCASLPHSSLYSGGDLPPHEKVVVPRAC